MDKKARIDTFTAIIWDWFAVHRRQLPWRDLTLSSDRDRGYRVLLSEIMLQQTQVPRVIPIYKRFLEEFPTLDALAAANNQVVIQAWRGMGYNSRALRLRDAAATIVDRYDGGFPQEMDELLAIKGIGHYTAAAVRNFAFDTPTACLDTNIRRILHRVFYGPERSDGTWKQSDTVLLELADQVLQSALQAPDKTTADWHAALMDYGSLVCTSRNPQWDNCPLTAAGICKAAYRVPKRVPKRRQEPGREMGGRFVPNRIFRGRIVDELRDAAAGLPLEEIGRRVCLDWSAAEHRQWLQGVVAGLVKDQLLAEEQSNRFILAS